MHIEEDLPVDSPPEDHPQARLAAPLIWAAVAVAGILGLRYLNRLPAPADVANYSFVPPAAIEGWHKVPTRLFSNFTYMSDDGRAELNGGAFSAIDPLHHLPGGDTADLVRSLQTSADQAGFHFDDASDFVEAEGVRFQIVVRHKEGKLLMNAVAGRGNDSYDIQDAIRSDVGTWKTQTALYKPAFERFVRAIKFREMRVAANDR